MRLHHLVLFLLCSVCGCRPSVVTDPNGPDIPIADELPQGDAPRGDFRNDPAVANGGLASIVVADDVVLLRLTLPVRSSKQSSTAAEWGLAAPSVAGDADPNRVIYDQRYLEAYVQWATHAPTACGAAEYRVRSGTRVTTFITGLDAAYLGQQFQERDLLRFLQERVEGERSEQVFHVRNAAACRAIREHPSGGLMRRLEQSPWDRDTVTVLQLLDRAQSVAAYPWVKRLVRDPSPSVRTAAVIALGSLARSLPAALDELRALLAEDELQAAAFDALRRAEGAAVPVLMQALDHDDTMVRNQAVYSLPWIPFSDAVPAILAALQHDDVEVRQWAVAAVLDIQSRGVDLHDTEVLARLRRMVQDEEELAATRQSAALVISNLAE